MKLRRIFFEAGNAALRPLGLYIGRLEGDFQTSVPLNALYDMIRTSLTEVWDRWYEQMAANDHIGYAPRITKTDFTRRIVDFLEEYRAFTGKNIRSGGLMLNNTISLFAAATYFDAPTIMDSGTYTGNSAWALSRACPNAAIHSFDITHIALRHRAPGVSYHLGDWSGIVREPVFGPAAFGFFDDHVDQVRRIEESVVRNVRYLVFDDDNPVNATHYGHNSQSFPKISFLHAETLRSLTHLEWQWLGRHISVPVDHDRLERARSHIAYYSRLPDLFATTGFRQQWPLSLVVLRDPAAASSCGSSSVIGR